jgi:hypothetical protein
MVAEAAELAITDVPFAMHLHALLAFDKLAAAIGSAPAPDLRGGLGQGIGNVRPGEPADLRDVRLIRYFPCGRLPSVCGICSLGQSASQSW